MKILFVNPIIYTSETADIKKVPSIKDTMSYDLCLAFQQAGHTITLAAGEPYRPEQEEDYPFEVLWLPCVLPRLCKPNVLPYCPALKKILKTDYYDLIISSEVFSLNSLLLARRCQGHLIVWHELAKHNNRLHQLPSKLWYGIVARLFFRRVPVVARSREAKAFISRYCGNVRETIIDHGVNLSKFEACTEKEPYFIVASQLIARKQIDKIIDRFAVFSATHPDYRLLLLGEGDKEAELKEQVQQLELSDKVLFFGKVSHDSLKEYLKRAKAMLVYTRQDNNMVSIVEAIACATPIVTTSVPYNASYIQANTLGIVNDNWDASDLEEICRHADTYIANCMQYRNEISTLSRVALFMKAMNEKE